MESTDTLTILSHFKTLQQSTEWSCGVTSALMVLNLSLIHIYPKTKPKLPELEREEAKLDVEGLVREAVEGTQLTLLRYGRD